MNSESDSLSEVSESTEPPRYPVRYVDRCSLYRKYIYDVDGKVVRGKDWKPLSVFSREIRERIIGGYVRFIYDLPNEYRYIITSHEQYARFQFERKYGSLYPFKYYHVYVDDDVRGKFPIARRKSSINLPDTQQDVPAA